MEIQCNPLKREIAELMQIEARLSNGSADPYETTDFKTMINLLNAITPELQTPAEKALLADFNKPVFPENPGSPTLMDIFHSGNTELFNALLASSSNNAFQIAENQTEYVYKNIC